MNAIEHGNRNKSDLPFQIDVWRSVSALKVRIGDHGPGGSLPLDFPAPDFESKLAGKESPPLGIISDSTTG